MEKHQAQQARAVRQKFLGEIHGATAHLPGSFEKCDVIASRAGLDPDIAYEIARELKDDGLVEIRTMDRNLRLSSAGRRTLEELADPTETRSPTVNVAYIGNLNGGQFQQGSHGSTQTYTAAPNEAVHNLTDLIAILAAGFDKTKMNADHRQDATANLQTLVAQERAVKPNRTIVREALSSLWEITKHTSADVLGHVICAYMKSAGWMPDA
jgi:hypothetical protein